MGTNVNFRWTRRSHRGWTWTDGVGVADDPFPEHYRLSVTGPGGQITRESAVAHATFSLGELPAQVGQSINLSVVMVGPKAPSREASAIFIL